MSDTGAGTPLAAAHVPDETTGVHRGPLPDTSLTYECEACGQDWPCDVVELSKAAKAVLDWYPKERHAGPHDWLASLIGYYDRG